jgi:REP element-mobilizing transposase RayT
MATQTTLYISQGREPSQRKAIFSDDLDRVKYLEILAKSAELIDIEVHAYVLMDNHLLCWDQHILWYSMCHKS